MHLFIKYLQQTYLKRALSTVLHFAEQDLIRVHGHVMIEHAIDPRQLFKIFGLAVAGWKCQVLDFVRTNIDRKNENCIGFFHNLPKKAQQSLTAIYSFCPWPLVSNKKWTELLEILIVSLEWMPSAKEVAQKIRFMFESPFRIQRFIQKVYLRCHSGKGPSPTSPNPPVRRASWVTRPLFTAPLRAV